MAPRLLLLALVAAAVAVPPASAAVASIDLGSEWLKVAAVHLAPGRAPIAVAINEMSKRKSPALAALADGNRLAGEEAAGITARHPAKVFSRMRDLLAKPFPYARPSPTSSSSPTTSSRTPAALPPSAPTAARSGMLGMRPSSAAPGAPRLPLGWRQVRAASVDPDVALAYKFPEVSFAYDERDVALYALGMGACGVDGKELHLVHHSQRHIKVHVY